MMKYKGYIGKVEFDAEANILHGEVVGIRDVVTFQGRSVEEIERAFRGSVDDYLAFCRQRGEQPDKPCSGRFVVRIPPDLHRRAAMLAGAAGQSLNAWLTECLGRQVTEELRAPRPATVGPVARNRNRRRPRTHRGT